MSATAALLFARSFGFMLRAPGFAHPSVPVMVRVAFAFVLAYALVPTVGGLNAPQGLPLLLALVTEMLVGLAIGLAASAIYEGAAAGGKLLDAYVGIQALNPDADITAGEGFSKLWGVVFLAAFFLLGGYRWLIGAFADTVTRIPPGAFFQTGHLEQLVMALPEVVLRAAILVAGPALVIGLAAQVGIGALARLIPRFANFTLNFPVVFGLILLVALLSLPMILYSATDMIIHPMPLTF